MLKKYFYHEEWNTGIIILSDNTTLDDIKNICNDKNTYWLNKKFHFQADPFMVEKEDKLYVFYEALNHWWTKGHIRCRILDKNFNELEDIAIDDVNQLNCHLSFPFIWQENGQYYMVPESHERQEVNIFKATEFPKHWQKIATPIKNKKCVDSVVLKQNDGYWLITSEHKTNQRWVFFSQQLSDNWQPIKIDIKLDDIHSRLGGGMIFLQNNFYLPCQECGHKEYGKSLFLKKLMIDNFMNTNVDNKKQHIWQEQTVMQIISHSKHYPDGIHTLNITKNYMVIDAKRWVFQPFNFFVRKYRQIISIFKK